MTEFWKSHSMHWCEVCKCWMNDTKAAKQHHEQGMGHKANLAKKIRDMGKKADDEKRLAARVESTMKRADVQAQAKFAADQAEAIAYTVAAHEAEEARSGRWEWEESSSYYYNEKHRWYYDPKTKWYYGGDPPDWAEQPPIPPYACFGSARHYGGPVPQPGPAPGSVPVGRTGAGASGSAAVAAGMVKQVTHKVAVELPKHPQMVVGGHQAAGVSLGRVGAAKGVGGMNAAKPSAAAPSGGDKRKRDDSVSAAELEARAKREAARARVASRTAQNFGFM